MIPHSVQPSFFSKHCRFPWVSGGFLERRIPRKNGEGTPGLMAQNGNSLLLGGFPCGSARLSSAPLARHSSWGFFTLGSCWENHSAGFSGPSLCVCVLFCSFLFFSRSFPFWQRLLFRAAPETQNRQQKQRRRFAGVRKRMHPTRAKPPGSPKLRQALGLPRALRPEMPTPGTGGGGGPWGTVGPC